MIERRRIAAIVVAVALVLGGYAFVATRPLQAVAPAPQGSLSFAALGDAPYYLWEDMRFRNLLRQLDGADLAWILHVGDIFWKPCTDAMYERHLRYFHELRHPVVYTPGDNEWFDCHEAGSGGFAPLERLQRLRQIFFADPARSLGGTPMALTSQAGTPDYAEFVENARWQRDGVVFMTVHMVGSLNAGEPFPGRSATDDEAVRRRSEAAAAWVRDGFAAARATGARAVVVAMHAGLGWELPLDHAERRALEPFAATLEEEAAAFAAPVLFVHGDEHEYTIDKPFVSRATGAPLTNVVRLQVPGSPEVGWVRVVIAAPEAAPPAGGPGALDREPPSETFPFAFEEYLIPAWKMW